MSADRFKNKYRIPSNRLQGYDYGATGYYYVTICTKNRGHYFGEIVNGKMQLSEIGEIAQSEWLKTTILRPDMNMSLDKFVVMPNHFHCIVFIGDNQYNTPYRDVLQCRDAPCRDALQCVSTMPTPMMPTPPTTPPPIPSSTLLQPYKNKFGKQSKNLSSVIRGFKIAVTTYARKHNIDFEWQERYHDEIIRNPKRLDEVREYIFNNPQNWNDDEFNDVKRIYSF